MDIKSFCKNLIKICGKGDGYILIDRADVGHGNLENLKAMMEAAIEYGKYK
jgi:hypothetical protein